MKRYHFLVSFVVALVILPYFSCKSAPPVQEPLPEPQPEQQEQREQPAERLTLSQALLNEFNDAQSRAEEARKRAMDFESPAYFPSEWEAAEDQFGQAGQIPRNTDSDLRDAIVAYNAAAESYDSVFMQTIPLYAQAREDAIVALRDKLIEAGARDIFPEPFPAADEAALTALDQYEAEDYYAARDSADKALAMYQNMAIGYDAWLARSEIVEMGFDTYDQENFDRADEVLGSGVDAFWAEEYDAAQENAEEALQRYNLVLSTGWTAHAELCYSNSDAARKEAIEAKAHVAVKDTFMEGETNYTGGIDSMDTKDYKKAAKLFADAEAIFITAKTEAEKKRREAMETIQEADKAIVESDKTVRKAESILEGGE